MEKHKGAPYSAVYEISDVELESIINSELTATESQFSIDS